MRCDDFDDALSRDYVQGYNALTVKGIAVPVRFWAVKFFISELYGSL